MVKPEIRQLFNWALNSEYEKYIEEFENYNKVNNLNYSDLNNLRLINNYLISCLKIEAYGKGIQFYQSIEEYACGNPDIYHNAACLFCKSNQLDLALTCIDQAGYYGGSKLLSLIKRDEDLKPLFNKENYHQILNKYKPENQWLYVEFWEDKKEELKGLLEERQLKEAEQLVNEIGPYEMTLVQVDFYHYLIMFYLKTNQLEKARGLINKAFHQNGIRFFLLDKQSVTNNFVWNKKIPQIYRDVLYTNETVQAYVRALRKHDKVDVNEIAESPFKWFKEKAITISSAKCFLSKEKIKKGAKVYEFYFHYQLESKPHYALVNVFNENEGAIENRNKYLQDNYAVEDFRLLNNYSGRIKEMLFNKPFDLLELLQLIATPNINPSLFNCNIREVIKDETYSPVDRPLYYEKKYRKKVNFKPINPSNYKEGYIKITTVAEPEKLGAAYGGGYINLLWLLIKCGYLDQIKGLLPQLPQYFPVLLLLFDREDIQDVAINYYQNQEFLEVWNLAISKYNKKKPRAYAKIIDFGMRYPEIRDEIATVLELYEIHLSASTDWNNELLAHFNLHGESGLLQLVSSNIQPIKVLNLMHHKGAYITNVSQGKFYYKYYEHTRWTLFYTLAFYAISQGKIEIWEQWEKGVEQKYLDGPYYRFLNKNLIKIEKEFKKLNQQ